MTGLAATGIERTFGASVAVAGIDFAVGPGEFVGLIGPNGAGKTSLLRMLAGLAAPSAGTVRLDGRPLAAIPARRRAQMIGYLAQGAECHWPLSVERLVMLGRLPHLGPWQRPDGSDAAAVEAALVACDVQRFRRRSVTTLSGGERARALLARALAARPAILLADEPVAGLDPYHQIRVMKTLADVATAGAGVVAVLHDLSLAARFCSRIVLIDQGRVVADGKTDAVLRPDILEPVYGVRVASVTLEGRPVFLPVAPLTDDDRCGG